MYLIGVGGMGKDLLEESNRRSGFAMSVCDFQTMLVFPDRVTLRISGGAEGRGKGHTEGKEGVGLGGDSDRGTEEVFDGEGSDGGRKSL